MSFFRAHFVLIKTMEARWRIKVDIYRLGYRQDSQPRMAWHGHARLLSPGHDTDTNGKYYEIILSEQLRVKGNA